MDRKRMLMTAKGKGKLATPPNRKSPRLAGLPPSLPPTSPKSVLRPNKLLVLAIASHTVETHPKARGSIQAPVVEPPKDMPKPKKVKVINLISDDEAEEKGEEATMEQPTLVANQEEPEEEEEDPEYEEEEEEEEEDPEESVEPEEIPSSWSLLSPFLTTPELGKDEYDDPHRWNYDGDLDQWGTNVVGGEPAAAQSQDSVDGSEGSWSAPSTTTD
ncbi:hypothetical protein PIB30_052859 [Stylosanthes scabra]|uniref:Uncharacterized protein n=1 Tax=Stylosanthes scabra TaxID=79078 RepID=A0ABU6UHR0_9FABA|nr:hypothetical protein [Stylosanthes scabra]